MKMTCTVCGKQTNTMFMTAIFDVMDRELVTDDEMRHSLEPYPPGKYYVCMGCFLKVLGVPLPKNEE